LHGFWVGKLTLADLQRADADGKTALDLAEAGGHKPVIRSLCGELAEKAAFEGDLPMVQKALEKCPDLPARQVMNRAAAGGALTVVRHLMGQHKDKSAEEKLRMMGAKPLPDTTANTALEAALGANQGDVVTALLDPDWWKDKAALSAFIRFKPSNGFSILNDYNRGQKPELMRLIEARLKQVEAAK
ncbi:MAG TPA: hypothetical protein VFE78_08400, partial [Gemmataceae bacterium]|nr:hypothetical protein [Gemmataceae bacterium]